MNLGIGAGQQLAGGIVDVNFRLQGAGAKLMALAVRTSFPGKRRPGNSASVNSAVSPGVAACEYSWGT